MIEKLVRDRIPEIARRRGDPDLFRTATPGQMGLLLRKKIVEECEELLSALPEDVPGEVADVIETVLAYAQELGYPPSRIENVRQLRLETHGGFRKCQVMRLD